MTILVMIVLIWRDLKSTELKFTIDGGEKYMRKITTSMNGTAKT